MKRNQPIVADDVLLSELIGKKLAVLVLDTLTLGVSGCRFGVPKPQEFLPKRQSEFHALATTLACVTVAPDPAGEPVSAIRASAARIAAPLKDLIKDLCELAGWRDRPPSFVKEITCELARHADDFFDALEAHLRLVGSGVVLGPELRKRCEEVLRALPVEFDQRPVAQTV